MWTELVDLHSHSRHSDGLWTPCEMATRAFESGVRIWSLTDHDTNTGWKEAQEECNRLGMKFIPGVEITCEVELQSETHNPTSWHLLAYFPDGASMEFSNWLAELKEARLPRMKNMLNALKEHGHEIPLADVEKHTAGALGRPHLARAMVEHGIVDSVQEAFEEWIGDSGPAFRERPLPSISHAVETVHEAGGITSLAHPKYYGISSEILVPALLRLGVDCIEAIHNSHPDSYRFELLNQGMPVTVGGDSHGTEKRPSPGKMVVPIRNLHPCFRP
ncbi:MAG: PHP domain-containing protein [Euryarchaeota archaeon]|nr:PHP domain-containing protein [Euryarchaeota archaeon]MBT5184253.1 PHP domain-containing protein [Euryarchaeota archaeon]